jgi:hypothetical protein
MDEPAELAAARKHLARAESDYRSEDGLFHLQEGLALLEEIGVDDAAGRHRAVAANLLSTYSRRICDTVRKLVEADPALPEPDLQHLFKLLLAFDSAGPELPAYVRSLKIEVVKRLIDLHYEGYSTADKQKMLEELAGIAGDEGSQIR